MDETKVSQQQITQWQLIYDGWDPDEQPLREALCTLGNGLLRRPRGRRVRARPAARTTPAPTSPAATTGCRARSPAGSIENEDLVNWPNWLCLRSASRTVPGSTCDAGGAAGVPAGPRPAAGLLTRHLRFRDRQGRDRR